MTSEGLAVRRCVVRCLSAGWPWIVVAGVDLRAGWGSMAGAFAWAASLGLGASTAPRPEGDSGVRFYRLRAFGGVEA